MERLLFFKSVMKVRIANNKIRFRLKEPEVRKFQQTGTVTEALQFGTGENEQVKFSLRKEDINEINVDFRLTEITVLVPFAQVEKWTSTELVGFEGEINTGKGKIISILVEKDFMCMDGREEDNAGSYPNPLSADISESTSKGSLLQMNEK